MAAALPPPGPLTRDGPDPGEPSSSSRDARLRSLRPRRPKVSPFFASPPSTAPSSNRGSKKAASDKSSRKSHGTLSPKSSPKVQAPKIGLSTRPLPPLSATSFGLIQEEFADRPFYLLLAVTFLIRTKGKDAIPIFRELIASYPTPAALAEADPKAIVPAIRHLGLGVVRCRSLQRYARMWLDAPPSRAVRYGLRHYPNPYDGASVQGGQAFGPEDPSPADMVVEDQEDDIEVAIDANRRGLGVAWEVAHIITGPYALDSWRIFCRDRLLERADDWLGTGRESTFQPEWMRVLPKDKELRVYLRWLWAREGWEWDPETGVRTVLSSELREAINSGQMFYDNRGQLVRVDSALPVEDVGGGGGGGENVALSIEGEETRGWNRRRSARLAK